MQGQVGGRVADVVFIVLRIVAAVIGPKPKAIGAVDIARFVGRFVLAHDQNGGLDRRF